MQRTTTFQLVRGAFVGSLALGLMGAASAQEPARRPAPAPQQQQQPQRSRPGQGTPQDQRQQAERARQAREQAQREQQARERQKQLEEERIRLAREKAAQEAERAEQARREQQQEPTEKERITRAREQGQQRAERVEAARGSSLDVATAELARQVFAREAEHRSRIARIARLEEIYRGAGDQDKLRQLGSLREREEQSYARDMAVLKEKLGPHNFERVTAAMRARAEGAQGSGRARQAERERAASPPSEVKPRENRPRDGGGR